MNELYGQLQGDRWEIKLGSDEYPKSLLDLDDPPEVIYGIGNKDALNKPSINIIGARKATDYGRECAGHFAALARSEGLSVVTGGARGIDTEALRSSGVRDVVVLGGGCNHVYPPENTPLFQKVINAGGVIISEYEWDTEPKPYMFRARNRIVAALSRATLVVEAGIPSGTYATVDYALRSCRSVWVIPGSIFSKASEGTNRLIYQGAQPVVSDESFRSLVSQEYYDLLMNKQDHERYSVREEGKACKAAAEQLSHERAQEHTRDRDSNER